MGYYDDKEFESKVGQLIYNLIIYERLKEYVIERVQGKDRSSFKIDLGEDRSGRKVVLDVHIYRVEDKKKKIEVPEGEPAPAGRKTASMILVSEKAGNINDIEISRTFEEILSGRRDLEDWRIDDVLVSEHPVWSLLEAPIDEIIVPEERKEAVTSAMLDRMVRTPELLPPICVRPVGGSQGIYELVYGYYQLVAYRTAGKGAIPAIVRRIGNEEASRLFAQNSQLWKRQPNLMV